MEIITNTLEQYHIFWTHTIKRIKISFKTIEPLFKTLAHIQLFDTLGDFLHIFCHELVQFCCGFIGLIIAIPPPSSVTF